MMFAKQVLFQYDRAALTGIVQDIAETNQLFKRPVPISAFSDQERDRILQALQLQYGQQLFDFTISTVTVACLKPFERSAIHKDKDSPNWTGDPTKSALNLPLSSCVGVEMNWYSLKPGGAIKRMQSARGWTVEGLSLHNAVKEFTIPCHDPFMVNPTEFHDIVNTTDEHHLIISIR